MIIELNNRWNIKEGIYIKATHHYQCNLTSLSKNLAHSHVPFYARETWDCIALNFKYMNLHGKVTSHYKNFDSDLLNFYIGSLEAYQLHQTMHLIFRPLRSLFVLTYIQKGPCLHYR